MGETRGRKVGRVVSVLLALAVTAGQVVPAMAGSQWPTRIERFEKYSPVYSGVVEPGTAKEELGLPEYLRAVVPLEETELDEESFVQAQPEADLSDGYTHYDYYYYGYVAPESAEDLYAAGEKVVYTIYYAETEEGEGSGETEAAGETRAAAEAVEKAYRVYGSIGGSENAWFACDEAGSISGVVLDVPVTWEDGGYEPEKEGKYVFTAEVTGYTCGEARPYAQITVKEGADSQEEEHTHEHESESGEETGEIHCTCQAGEDIYSDQHAQDCPYYEEEELLCTCEQQSNEKGEQHALTCPCYVPAAQDCHCGPNGEAIDADNYPWAHQEDCVHFSPIECMCREEVETVIENYDEQGNKIGEHTEWIPGEFSHQHDPENPDCPLYGKDTVTIEKLEPESLSARLMGGTSSVMAKEDAERIAAHQQGTASQGAVLSAAEPEKEPLYPALGEIRIIEGSAQSGRGYDTDMELLASSTGANFTNLINTVKANTPTSGNADYISDYTSGTTIPGSWIDYVNTIYQNKVINEWAWADESETGVAADWKYAGDAAREMTGLVTENPKRMPSAVGGVWQVYSAAQLRYALGNGTAGQTISLERDVDFNCAEYNWGKITINRTLTLEGNGHTIYNLGSLENARAVSFLYIPNPNSNVYEISDLNFDSAFMATTFTETTDTTSGASLFDAEMFSEMLSGTGGVLNRYTNINCRNCHMFSAGSVAAVLSTRGKGGAYKQIVVEDCSTSGTDHVSSVAVHPGNHRWYADSASTERNRLENCMVTGQKICSRGGHLGGVASCSAWLNFESCFFEGEIYASVQAGGLGNTFQGNVDNCYAAGKLEGFMNLSGLVHNFYDLTNTPLNIRNSYSTMLVGMRTNGNALSGFVNSFTNMSASDCYAAGEVGNYDVDMNTPVNIGGFTDASTVQNWTNCYYDKQTTAMREWASGDSQTISGVTGVLTTDIQTSEGQTVHGMTGQPGAAGEQGFTGFSDNSQWVYQDQHYPQLAVFANATEADWGSAETASLVKAYSAASTATVFLNTWSEGYDWDARGVRTQELVNYNRVDYSGLTHVGYINTYDTVREITTDFQTSYSTAHQSNWVEMIPGGAQVTCGDIIRTDTIAIDGQGNGTIKHPGMNWFEIQATVDGQTGSRPLRLIAFMQTDAGEDQTVYAGQRYNHRTDVELHMIDYLVDDLVIGMDDGEIWAYSSRQGYPKSPEFYNVWTEPTEFTASHNALLRTEIWLAEQNPDGSYVQDAEGQYGYVDGAGNSLVPGTSVKVTGPGTGYGTTLDERKWNGELPFYPDTSIERKYIVSYYWVLEDGRYNEDYKIITVQPGQYDVTVEVKNLEDDTPNDALIYPAAGADNGADLGYTLPASTAASGGATGISFTKNSAAAWKKVDGDVKVKKLQVDLYANDASATGGRTLMGTAELDAADGEITAGSTITIPTTYYYAVRVIAGDIEREETRMETVDVTYTIAEKQENGQGTGEYYLRLNKLYNLPGWEAASAGEGTNDDTGIPAGTQAYINDTQFHTDVTIWVEGGMDFSFIKTDKEGTAFQAGEAEFQLYSCGHVHDASCGGLADPGQCSHVHEELAGSASQANGCWVVEGESVRTAQTDADGRVTFAALSSGEYMLAEVRTKEGMQLPQGQWLIQVDAAAGSIGITAKGEMPPAFKTEGTGENTVLKLPNYPIWTMPSSGGMGPLLFTVGGIVLIGAAGLMFLVTRDGRKNRGKKGKR